MIYFVTVNYYSSHLITQLISSISENHQIPYKIIIVNNSADDREISKLNKEFILILEAKKNLGFGKACNLAIQWVYSQDPDSIVWVINPDSYLLEDSLIKVSSFFEKYPKISIVGTMIYTPNGNVWFSQGKYIANTGSIISECNLNNLDTEYIASEWVSGCSLIINLQKFLNYPFFDPDYFLYYEDFDFCKRYSNQGHLIVVTPQIGIIHQPSSITNKNIFNKFKHSTYSYLLTLEKYANQFLLLLRLSRIMLYAFILILFKPKIALGKFYGILLYIQHRI